jgi:hypothetical protein
LGRFDEREINERSYVFVQQRNLTAVSLNQHIEPDSRNQTILRGTQTTTSYTTENGRIVNRGIPVERFEKETGQVVPRHTLADAGSAGGARVSGNQVEMYRPKLSDATPKNPPPGVQGVQGGTRTDSSIESTRKQEKAQRNAQTNEQTNQQNRTKQQRQIQAQQEQDRLNRDKQQRKAQVQQDQQRLNQQKQQHKADRQAQDQARRQQKQERKQQRQNQSTPPPKKEKNKNPSSEIGG